MEIWSKNISGRGNQGAQVLKQSLLSVFRGKPRVAGAERAEGELSETKWRGVQGERLEKRGALMAILSILTFTRAVWRILRGEPQDLIYALMKPLWPLCSEGEPRKRQGVRLGLIALI